MLTLANKGGISASASQLLGIVLVAGLVSAAVALLWSAATGAESRSEADLRGRLRALDELAGQGAIRPEEYARAQSALLKEN